MRDKLLAIDVGNSTVAIGVFSGEQLLDSWHLASRVLRTMDETWLTLIQFLQSRSVNASEISSVGISSVVPDLTFIYANLARERMKLEPVIVSPTTVPHMKIAYNPPESVGADRICGAVAGFTKYGGPLIAIDMGTATVFDVVGSDGSYLGGLIAPGLITAVDSLHHAAAQLPKVELQFPKTIISTSTIGSIQSGILFGALEMVDGIVERIQRDLPAPATVIATGGFAKLLKPQSRTIQHLEPNLVLEGIRLITSRQ